MVVVLTTVGRPPTIAATVSGITTQAASSHFHFVRSSIPPVPATASAGFCQWQYVHRTESALICARHSGHAMNAIVAVS